MHLTINLDNAQSSAIDSAATKTGLTREQVVLEAVDHLVLKREFGADGYAQLMAGIADDEAGRYASDDEVAAVFRKYGVRKR